ncbi:MAG: lysine-sensitive aspartokinase 3 [Patescibacteria group bacterium]
MNRDIIVAKFGGTSMADAPAIAQSAKVAIVNKVALVVVSATSGTTNQLVELVKSVLANNRSKTNKIIAVISKSHRQAADELEASQELLDELESVLKSLQAAAHKLQTDTDNQKQISDRLLSFGELLSSILMMAAMNQQAVKAEFIDAREVIKTDNHFGRATPVIERIRGRSDRIIRSRLSADKILITQGFIGSTRDGVTTTLGRGGSDYSAALLAEALDADKLQIWTDVSGIASTDPRIAKTASRIEQLTFQEAAELATAGAKVLYPRTITPLRRANIDLYVGNTFEPEAGGTTITNQTSHRPLVRAIALKSNQSILSLTSPEMAHQFGYLARVFDIFAQFKVSIDQISTSEISIAVVVDDQVLLNKALINGLKQLGEVSTENDLSVVSMIGNEINNSPGLIQNIFANLERKGAKVPVRMICQGASRHNFCFLVPDKHGRNTVRRLHAAFIEDN